MSDIEEHLKLLGDVAGKRVLELGFTTSSSAVELAGRGALVVAVDTAASRVAAVKQVAEAEGVRIDVRQGDFAELAFVRAETVDAAISDCALEDIDDIDRVFRQVHRVLRADGILLFTLPHPAAGEGSYFQRRTIGDVFGSLTRANFRIDTLLEPEPLLVVRARKLGI